MSTFVSKQTSKQACLLLAALAAHLPVIAAPAVTFSPTGVAHIVDLTVPIPTTISAPAQQMLRKAAAAGDPTRGLTASLTELRAGSAAGQAKSTEALLAKHPSTIKKSTMAGVPVALVTPAKLAANATGKLLINVHGGAFFLGQGSITEAIPIAARTGIPVLAIDYRLAPEHPFPAAVDDTVAVYRELLKSYQPERMALYGSSAGAVLSAQALVRARQLKLPLPAAVGFFSGTADFARAADSEAFFTLGGLGALVTPVATQAKGYLASNDLRDPVMSPAYADLKGFPPTLLMAGTRDFFLGGTTNFHRALLKEKVPAQLVIFDAMPHVHWGDPSLPETDEALDIQAAFLAEQVAER